MNPSSRQYHPYTIGLLNDLHYHFPDILYRPERFTNLQDILAYIGQIAAQNPYERNRDTYLRSLQNPSTSSQNHTRSQRAQSPSQPTTSSFRTSGPSHVENIRIRVPLSTFLSSGNSSSSQASDTLMTTLLASLMGNSNGISTMPDIYSTLLHPFYNLQEQSVPTQNDIQRATSIPTAHDIVDGTCSICQEPCLPEGPICRRINHCGHLFHRECIDVWFQTHSTCPMCRYDIRSHE